MIFIDPIKFNSIYKERIWGYNRLSLEYNKNFPKDVFIGESWEISDIEGDLSIVKEGELKGKTIRDIIDIYKGGIVGEKVYKEFGNAFPLLIKLIDTRDNLSIQVHPDDYIAKHRHNSFGKTEMWYIMDSKEHSKIMIGFNQAIDKQKYLDKFSENRLEDIINFESVYKGDVFFVPSGRIHSIGKDIVLAEIQQKSDITYRIYDWDRVDDRGNRRQLHVQQALDVIDFNNYDNYKTEYERDKFNQVVDIVNSKYFNTKIINIKKSSICIDYSDIDSFVIYICVDGGLSLKSNEKFFVLNKGETLLLPASINKLDIKAEYAKVLQVYSG